jgi:hypothetical protein
MPTTTRFVDKTLYLQYLRELKAYLYPVPPSNKPVYRFKNSKNYPPESYFISNLYEGRLECLVSVSLTCVVEGSPCGGVIFVWMVGWVPGHNPFIIRQKSISFEFCFFVFGNVHLFSFDEFSNPFFMSLGCSFVQNSETSLLLRDSSELFLSGLDFKKSDRTLLIFCYYSIVSNQIHKLIYIFRATIKNYVPAWLIRARPDLLPPPLPEKRESINESSVGPVSSFLSSISVLISLEICCSIISYFIYLNLDSFVSNLKASVSSLPISLVESTGSELSMPPFYSQEALYSSLPVPPVPLEQKVSPVFFETASEPSPESVPEPVIVLESVIVSELVSEPVIVPEDSYSPFSLSKQEIAFIQKPSSFDSLIKSIHDLDSTDGIRYFGGSKLTGADHYFGVDSPLSSPTSDSSLTPEEGVYLEKDYLLYVNANDSGYQTKAFMVRWTESTHPKQKT